MNPEEKKAEHQEERKVLFANESFLIGMLQAVSGASLAGGLSQLETLQSTVGKFPHLVFLTLMGISLVAAVFAGYWKHNYKMWDVKSRASISRKNLSEAQDRGVSAGADLTAMRRAMCVSTYSIAGAISVLLLALWVKTLCSV